MDVAVYMKKANRNGATLSRLCSMEHEKCVKVSN